MESVQAVKVRAKFVLKQGLDHSKKHLECPWPLSISQYVCDAGPPKRSNASHTLRQWRFGACLSDVITCNGVTTEGFIVLLPVLFAFDV